MWSDWPLTGAVPRDRDQQTAPRMPATCWVWGPRAGADATLFAEGGNGKWLHFRGQVTERRGWGKTGGGRWRRCLSRDEKEPFGGKIIPAQGRGVRWRHQGVALAVFRALGTCRCGAGRGGHWRLLSRQVRGSRGVYICVYERESEWVCVCDPSGARRMREAFELSWNSEGNWWHLVVDGKQGQGAQLWSLRVALTGCSIRAEQLQQRGSACGVWSPMVWDRSLPLTLAACTTLAKLLEEPLVSFVLRWDN